MATLSAGGRITLEVLVGELERLRMAWAGPVVAGNPDTTLQPLLGEKRLQKLDLFDRAQLACVVEVCRDSPTLSEAGRKLFSVSREKRLTANDADRLRKYLARFDLDWQGVKKGMV